MCSVIELPVPGKRSRYLAGFANFAVITQYNRSIFMPRRYSILQMQFVLRARGTLPAAMLRLPVLEPQVT